MITAAAFVLSMGAAKAADMPVKAPPTPVPVWTWDGAYIGINGGYSWSHWNTTCPGATLCLPATPGSFVLSNSYAPSVKGGVFGGQIGRNWQNGKWVFGLEGDLDWSGERASLSNTPSLSIVIGNFLTTVTSTDTNDWRLKWFATGRVRAGVTQDTWLFYATGGLAVGGMSYGATSSSTATITTLAGTPIASATIASGASESVTRFGGAIGAGIEKAFTNNLIGRIEYLYLDFGNHTFDAGTASQVNVRMHDNIVRGALSWKFDCCAVGAR